MKTSFEFFPPRTDKGKQNLAQVRQELSKIHPEYFSVTFGAGGTTQDATLETVLNIQPLLSIFTMLMLTLDLKMKLKKWVLIFQSRQALCRLPTIHNYLDFPICVAQRFQSGSWRGLNYMRMI